MKYLSTNIEKELNKDKKIKTTGIDPIGNAKKDKVSLAVEYLPPGWYGKEENRKLADTSFDSMDSSPSKTKQREGNKNIIESLKKKKSMMKSQTVMNQLMQRHSFCISNSQRKGIGKIGHRKKFIWKVEKNRSMKHFKNLNSQ